MIGGLALASYGAHRATKDVDLLIDAVQAKTVKDLFLKNGFKISNESEEVLQFTGSGNIDFLLARRPMSLEMLKRAKVLPPFEIKCVDLDKIDVLSVIRNEKSASALKSKEFFEFLDEYWEIFCPPPPSEPIEGDQWKL